MTKEDKELLKDLCSRLPYQPLCDIGIGHPVPLKRILVDETDDVLLDFYDNGKNYQLYLSEVKPCLRPMSSMTEKERKKLDAILVFIGDTLTCITGTPQAFDWLNAHHFDYRGLIEKGLAVGITEENNPYKN